MSQELDAQDSGGGGGVRGKIETFCTRASTNVSRAAGLRYGRRLAWGTVGMSEPRACRYASGVIHIGPNGSEIASSKVERSTWERIEGRS